MDKYKAEPTTKGHDLTPTLDEDYPNWENDLAFGESGEQRVIETLRSLGNGKVEVKTDRRAEQTGNVYIEYECNGCPSGLKTSDADWWAFVLGNRVVFIPSQELRELANHYAQMPARRKEQTRGTHTTKGIVIPIERLVEV